MFEELKIVVFTRVAVVAKCSDSFHRKCQLAAMEQTRTE